MRVTASLPLPLPFLALEMLAHPYLFYSNQQPVQKGNFSHYSTVQHQVGETLVLAFSKTHKLSSLHNEHWELIPLPATTEY